MLAHGSYKATPECVDASGIKSREHSRASSSEVASTYVSRGNTKHRAQGSASVTGAGGLNFHAYRQLHPAYTCPSKHTDPSGIITFISDSYSTTQCSPGTHAGKAREHKGTKQSIVRSARQGRTPQVAHGTRKRARMSTSKDEHTPEDRIHNGQGQVVTAVHHSHLTSAQHPSKSKPLAQPPSETKVRNYGP